MKALVITTTALEAARAAVKANGNKVHASNCLIAQAAAIAFNKPEVGATVVKDCGSFYADTNNGNLEFDGGYNGAQAFVLRGIIDLFRQGKDNEIRVQLPLTITIKQ